MRGRMILPSGNNAAQRFTVNQEGRLNRIIFHRMDQSHRAGRLRPDGLSCGDHLNGFLKSYQPRQPRGTTSARNNPKRYFRQANARARRHDAHATGHGNLCATA